MTTYPNPGNVADMPPTPNKVESTWGNAIRDRTVQNFATTTDRDAAITSPVVGQHCYVTGLGLQQYAGATDGWTKPWYQAWGPVAAPVKVTADQGSITTITDVTGASITWTAQANRRYRVTFSLLFANSGTSGSDRITVTDGSNAAQRVYQAQPTTAASGQTITGCYFESGLSVGSVTRKLRATSTAGTGTISNSASALDFFIEDAGPNGDPS